jgi:hypothetical protein
MPDFDDLPFDDVTRAASNAADEPDFAILAAKGVRRRNRRRASYAGVAAVALVGTLGVVQLAGRDEDSAPDPAGPDLPAGLVFTRGDGSTFEPEELSVDCERVDDATYVVVSGQIAGEPPADPERSEQTFVGQVDLRMPIRDVRDGAQLPMAETVSRAAASLFAPDPTTGDEWSSSEEDASGQVRVESARCGATPAIVAEVDGVLGSETSDATVKVQGRLALEARKPLEDLAAGGIVDDPDSRFRALAVSDDDPDIQAAVWQQCRSGDDCVEKYAVVVTDDGFLTRTVVDRVFDGEPMIAAAGPVFHVLSGLGSGEFLKPDGSLVGVQPGKATTPGAVVAIGSGLPVWTIFDGEHLTATLLPDGAPDLSYVNVLPDGTLAGIDRRGDYVWSVDAGVNWDRRQLNGGPNALYEMVPTDGSQQVVIEGADGATLFPFVAVHRARSAGGAAFERVTVPGDPRAYLSGEAVLPDGRLLVAVEAWSDTRPGPEFVTPPGLYVSAGDDWSTYEEVEAGAPYAAVDDFQPSWLGTAVTAQGVIVFLKAPPGDPNPAYSSSDGGLTWQPVPGR